MPLKTIVARKQVRLSRLARSLDIPGEALARALVLGGVQVNGKRVREAGFVVQQGSRLSICWGEEPPAFEFDPKWIVFEDDWLLVMNKPAGMTTQGTRCFDVNHLYYFAKEYLNGYAGLHHRLDRDTTGLVLFTKDPVINREIGELFEKRIIHKTYAAVVHGNITEPILINAPIGRVPELKPARFWVNTEGARPAETDVKPVKSQGALTLVEAHPITGRTHQIRVHLASIEHPVVGDAFYNHDEILRNVRCMLHCQGLSFVHPITGEMVELTVPLPVDMKSLLDAHGLKPV